MVPFRDIFQVDQKKVYDILFAIFSATEAWVYSKTNRKEKRGRKLFLGFYAHYLGPNKVDQLSAYFTHRLHNLEYHREKNNCNFEKYQAAHLEQHNISVGMEGHSYSGIDDRAKFRYLVIGINNDKLEVVKIPLIASPALRQYFIGVCSFFLD